MNALIVAPIDAPLRRAVAELFEQRGYTVFLVESAEVALVLADAARVDLAFVDLPDGPIGTLLAGLRGLRPGVRVLVVGGEGSDAYATHERVALRAGATLGEVRDALDRAEQIGGPPAPHELLA